MDRHPGPYHLIIHLFGALIIASCGPAPSESPTAGAPATIAPTASSMVTPAVEPTPDPTASPTIPPTAEPTPGPTASPTTQPTAQDTPGETPPASIVSSLGGHEILAWDVASDGSVYVLDAASILYQLEPGSLTPLAQSDPLFEPHQGAPAHLATSDDHVFVASHAISQTLVLERAGLSPVIELNAYGPLDIEPDRRLFMIPQNLEQQWPWGNFEIWAYSLADLARPPERARYAGSTFNDLTVDTAAGRLVVLASNYNTSPPHRGQNYEVFSLYPLTSTTSYEWERGTLTPPVIHPKTGEVLGTRVGLNLSRRFLTFDLDGNEARSLPALDGQPAIDPGGEWIYLLRQRGLWVLREPDLEVQAILPFTGPPPAGVALSPEGETLYLLGNGWLAALSAAELRDEGFQPVGPMPAYWFEGQDWYTELEPHLYPSPRMEEDGVAFVQLVTGGWNVLETYRTQDHGETWQLLGSLLDPALANMTYLALSPDFTEDRTLTALKGNSVVRSTDAGLAWEPWEPRIAFTSERDGNREIYTMDAEGQDVRRLTSNPAADENPAWSPAWTRLAFQSERTGNWDIFDQRIDCESGDEGMGPPCDLRQLTRDPADDLLPAWSPDGRSIAFVSTRDGNPEIYVMDSDGQNPRRLTFHPAGDWRPAWLPDSRRLVFASDRGGDNDIYQMAVPPPEEGPPASEPEVTVVLASPADDRDPAIMATYVDRLLFLSDRDGFFRTYQQDLGFASSPARTVTDTGQPEAHPATLPGETTWILVSSPREGPSNIHRTLREQSFPLAPSPAWDGQPAAGATGWRPDAEASLLWLETQD